MIRPTARPRAILFDWDGTLVDNWPVIHSALNATLTRHDMAPWTLAETYARISGSQRDSFPLIFGERWQAARDHFYAEFEARHLAELRVLPGAEALLAALADTGIYLGVVSNKHGPFLRREAAHLRWDRFFGRIVGATDAAADKPSAAPVHLALDGSAVGAGADVWLVGDSATDLHCARNAGCLAVIIRQEGGNPNALGDGEAADLEFPGLAALAGLVDGLPLSI